MKPFQIETLKTLVHTKNTKNKKIVWNKNVRNTKE